MKKAIISIMAGTIMLGGCTFVGTNESINPLESQSVDTSQSFYMIYPKNGVQQTFFAGDITENEDSAADASAVFYKKFYKQFGGLTLSDENISLSDGFAIAKNRGDKYLITMDINEWKDAFYMTCRPSQQQGQMTTLNQAMDSADVTISVYDVTSQQLLNRQRIQNSGCPTVFLSLIPVGKMSPDSRLRSSLDEWFENLQ